MSTGFIGEESSLDFKFLETGTIFLGFSLENSGGVDVFNSLSFKDDQKVLCLLF